MAKTLTGPRLFISFNTKLLKVSEFIVVETEPIATTFTLASFDGLSTAAVGFLYRNLKIMRKVIKVMV